MNIMDAAITPIELKHRLAAFPPPTLIDVRRQPAFEQDPDVVPGALRRLARDRRILGRTRSSRGDPSSSTACAATRSARAPRRRCARYGLDARYLAGGLEQWRAEGHATKRFVAPTRWVTRERPKIDRIACPWLVRRFVDPSAEFFYVPNAEVRAFAAKNGATAYDVPDVPHSHVGPECSFDAFIRIHELDHPALGVLARIVRGADTGSPQLAREAPGLSAASLGLSAMFADDHAMLKWGMLVYDSLYAWCREAQTETHGWYPETLRTLEHA